MYRTAASPNFPCETCQVRDKSICATLSDEELCEINAIVTEVRLRAKQTVFFEGDENTYLFNVVEGSVRLSKLLVDGRRQITGFLFPGDFLGLSFAGSYAYSAESLTDTTLCRFNRNRLTGLLDRFPKLEHRLLELTSNELMEAQSQMLMLGQKKAIERLSTTLCRLMRQIGHKRDNETFLHLPMSRQDLADYAGVTIETVSRCFSQLRQEGIIETPHPALVHVVKEEQLSLLSGA